MEVFLILHLFLDLPDDLADPARLFHMQQRLVHKVRENSVARSSVEGLSVLSFPVLWFLFSFTDFLYFFA